MRRQFARQFARRKSYGDDVESEEESKKQLPIGAFNYEKGSKTKKLLVRRRSLGEVHENNLIVQRDTVLPENDSFEREVQTFLQQFESISKVRFSNSKVDKVSLYKDIVLPDLNYTETEEKLGFDKTTNEIPEILRIIRYLIMLLEKIKMLQDNDFYGKWVVLARGSLVDPKFALKKIHWLYDYAFVLATMAIQLDDQNGDSEIRLQSSFYEKSEHDQNFNTADEEKTPQQRRQLADSVHRNMAKFLISISTLEAPVKVLEILWETLLDDLEESGKKRILVLLEHISSSFYRLYSDFFSCDRNY